MSSTSGRHHFVVTSSATCQRQRDKMATDLRRDRQCRFRSLAGFLSESALAAAIRHHGGIWWSSCISWLPRRENLQLLHPFLSLRCNHHVHARFERHKLQMISRDWLIPFDELGLQEKSEAELHSFTSRFALSVFNPSTKGNIFKHQSDQPGFHPLVHS